jgi:hypothetical protein
MKTFLATVALIALIGPAQAQFKATPHTSTFEGGNFECGILQLAEGRRDADPVATINIFLGFNEDDDKVLDTMNVSHGTAFGANYSRSDQYKDVSLVQTPGKLEVIWHGVWKKNSSVIMTGRIWNDATTGRWFYSEFQTRDGQPQMRMLAGCHHADAG